MTRSRFNRTEQRRLVSYLNRALFGDYREGGSNLYNFRLGHRARDFFTLNIHFF